MDEMYFKFSVLNLSKKTPPKEMPNEAPGIFIAMTLREVPNLIGFKVSTGPINIFISQALEYLPDHCITNAANCLGRLFRSCTPLRRGQIFDLAANAVACRNQHEINQLTMNSVRELAICGAFRAIEYITRPDENSTSATKHSDPVALLITGVTNGKSEKDNFFIPTRDEKMWQPANIFNHTVISVKNDKDKNTPVTPNPARTAFFAPMVSSPFNDNGGKQAKDSLAAGVDNVNSLARVAVTVVVPAVDNGSSISPSVASATTSTPAAAPTGIDGDVRRVEPAAAAAAPAVANRQGPPPPAARR
jgi:hypothetical protein